MTGSAHTPTVHDHVFGQDRPQPGERRTRIVVVVTAVMMVVEIAAGVAFGSMALLADGLHMASHAVALGVAAFAYWYARRHARDPRFSFGTGKVNALGGFTGAVLLSMFALLMAWESVQRLLAPVEIVFDQAILVAALGLLVNAACAVILVKRSGHDHDHDHGHGHGEDHNLRSAYVHVIADALTSVLAIIALLTGKYFGSNWMDPAMGLVGAALVARWSVGLLRVSARVLLDRQAPESERQKVERALTSLPGTQITDLHLWSIGPGLLAAEITVSTDPPRSAQQYQDLLGEIEGLSHVTIEVHHPES